MSTLRKHILPNGVRVLVEPLDYVQSASIGLWCATGSRHERDGEEGITHFIEHMLFKGTGKRTAKQIAEEIEGRGGVLNAFTDKEYTCYYCRVLAEDVSVGVDVLSDMMTASLLDPEELEREKGVVLEEIKRAQDEPGDYVHDLHLETRWGQHPLGKAIIGTSESVGSFERQNLASYIDRRYRAENVLLAVAGNVDADALIGLAERTLGGLGHGSEDSRPPRPESKAALTHLGKDVEQMHFCVGADGCSLYDEDLYATIVLDGVLGSGMSSRLFQEIREKRGLAYAVGSYHLAYSAGGAFTVYGGTSPRSWPLVRDLIEKEFSKVREELVPDDELARVKKNLSGHLVLALESMSSRMMRMAKNELVHGRDVPVEETLAKLQAVDAHGLRDLAQRILAPENVGTTTIGPAA